MDAATNLTEKRSNMMTRLREVLASAVPLRFRTGIAIVPVVRMAGPIGLSTPLRPGLTLGAMARVLDKAFGMRGAKAVALVINSPGGSAVQSHLLFARIKQLAAEKKLPVLAFVEDVAASGGYMIACAADEIICDPSSIVGSIGVMGASFGFQEAIKKLGIERRIYTAGGAQGLARSVHAGRPRRRCPPADDPAGNPQQFHCVGEGKPRYAAVRPRKNPVFRRVLDR